MTPSIKTLPMTEEHLHCILRAIRLEAYDIWQHREPMIPLGAVGNAESDWLQAEDEVLSQLPRRMVADYRDALKRENETWKDVVMNRDRRYRHGQESAFILRGGPHHGENPYRK